MKIYQYNGKANVVDSRVYAARQARNLSQADLSARLQLENVLIEQKAISRIERGERVVTDYEVLTLAKVLQVEVAWLLTGKSPTQEPPYSTVEPNKSVL